MENKKSLLPKILIPVAIVIVIGAMWIIKMQINKPEPQTAAVIDGADFSLSVASVNYDTLFEYKVPVIVDYGSI